MYCNANISIILNVQKQLMLISGIILSGSILKTPIKIGRLEVDNLFTFVIKK